MTDHATTAEFEEMSPPEAADELDTDTGEGLSSGEAQRRLQRHGRNEIEEERHNPLVRLLSHFWGPIPWMIEVAMILAGALGRWEDFAVISAMLLINGGVSFWHEHKAQNAIEALKQKLSPEARVLRDGELTTVDAGELVPGDVIELRMGDIVPADVKVTGERNASVDESALTGESLPVTKERGDMAYSSTTVKQGETRALVVATGEDTRFARAVELVAGAGEKSHFQKAVLRIGYFLIGTTAVLVAVILTVGILSGDPLFKLVFFSLGLVLAGIPQALPAVLSVTMSIGASRLARKKAIVSRLAAMEETAGVQVLCADKTGTLTKNQLELQDPVMLHADDPDDLVLAAALTARRDSDDPIDNAVLSGLGDRSALDEYEIEEFQPFNPTDKLARATVRSGERRFSVAKGAPQVILDLVDPADEERERVTSRVDELGEQGYRALGVARTREGDEDSWEYLGILPLLDPPREETEEVVREARDKGLDVRMVTGDHEAIAAQIAGQLGLGGEIANASDYFQQGEGGELESPREEDVSGIPDGFARVTPEHKYHLIKKFQGLGCITAMTGDGVNDAPALKQADVGVAVDTATDAARAAADLILTAPGLGVILRAVEEARRIFERMTSYATFRIAESMRVLLFVSISVLVFGFYPVTPIMIVMLAILNDIPIMTIAFDNAPTAKKPVRWDMGRVLFIASVLSVTGVATSFLLYWIVKSKLGLDEKTIQTIMFLKLLVAGHMTIFLTRNTGALWQRPLPALSLFAALEGTQVVGTLFAVYGVLVHPIGWGYALMVWGFALASLLVLSGIKIAAYRLFARYRDAEDKT